jgi:hypothetical protein
MPVSVETPVEVPAEIQATPVVRTVAEPAAAATEPTMAELQSEPHDPMGDFRVPTVGV